MDLFHFFHQFEGGRQGGGERGSRGGSVGIEKWRGGGLLQEDICVREGGAKYLGGAEIPTKHVPFCVW